MEYNTYLSDDEVDIENNETIEFDQYGMPIEEVNEDEELELRRIINNKILSINSLNDYNTEIKTKSVKISKIQKNKTMSLGDLNNLINKQLEEKKPKKFISKRLIEKKALDPLLSNIKETKRHFNPRLIPYLFSEEYKNNKICNESKKISFDNLEFPSL